MSAFSFKKFDIMQDKCAMKIGTDGVLLGAWAAITQAPSILDIGTGTGVLALMAAQRNPIATIDAIEIEPRAYQQAVENINNSSWSNRVSAIHSSLQSFHPQTTYDAIISNPPYFDKKKSTHINDSARNIARSTDSLPFEDLLQNVYRLLSPSGSFFLVMPYQEGNLLAKLALDYGLHLKQLIEVSPRVEKLPNRLLLEFSKNKTDFAVQQMAIRKKGKGQKDYTTEFESLHKDFLLFL